MLLRTEIGRRRLAVQERAELLGGHLQAAATDSGGFDLLVTLGALS
jgi:hypothetical protein